MAPRNSTDTSTSSPTTSYNEGVRYIEIAAMALDTAVLPSAVLIVCRHCSTGGVLRVGSLSAPLGEVLE